MNELSDFLSLPASRVASYTIRLARETAEIRAAQRLRFEVFNLELNEGLDASYLNGLDADVFDECCDHLLVQDARAGTVVGTYRLQTGLAAAKHHGYCSEQEFDFAVFEPIRREIVELDRACIHREHRKLAVLNLLWRGIARYASARQARYLIGCSSISGQDEAAGAALYEQLRTAHLAEERFRTEPYPSCRIAVGAFGTPPAAVPKLLRSYLSMGARICGPPALDREFKTIDFLTLLDMHALPTAARHHFIP